MLGISQVTGVCLLFMSSLDHTWTYANKVTHGGLLDSFQMWPVSQEDQPCDWRVPGSPGRGAGLQTGQSCGQWCNQPCLHSEAPVKALDTEVQRSFLIGKHTDTLGGWHALIPYREGTEALSFFWSPRPKPVWLVLICILHSKAVFPSSISCSSEIIKSEGILGTPEFVAILSEVQIARAPPKAGVWSKGSLLGNYVAKTYGIWCELQRVSISVELSCSVPGGV